MSHFLNPVVNLQSFIVFSVSETSDTVDSSPSFLKYFIPLSFGTHPFLLIITNHMESLGLLIFNVSKYGLLISLLKFSPYIVFLISINTNSTLPVSQIKTLEQVLTLFFIPDPKFCPSNLIFYGSIFKIYLGSDHLSLLQSPRSWYKSPLFLN